MANRKDFWGAIFVLQGRTSSSPQWGVYSTARVEAVGTNDTLERAIERAKRSLEALQQRWHSNFDSSIQFRIQ